MNFKETIDAYFAAVNGRNLEAYSALLKREGKNTLILPNGTIIEGAEKILDFHRSWFEDRDWSMESEVLHLWEIGDVAGGLFKVTYRDVKASGEPFVIHYYLNLLFQLVEGRWLLYHDQNTLIA